MAVPDMEAAAAIVDIKKGIKIPLVADIHFDFRLALAALESKHVLMKAMPIQPSSTLAYFEPSQAKG